MNKNIPLFESVNLKTAAAFKYHTKTMMKLEKLKKFVLEDLEAKFKEVHKVVLKDLKVDSMEVESSVESWGAEATSNIDVTNTTYLKVNVVVVYKENIPAILKDKWISLPMIVGGETFSFFKQHTVDKTIIWSTDISPSL